MNLNIEEIDRYLLILMFLVAGAYGYVEALTFGGNTGTWPKMLSAFIFLGATLLLFQNYLPESIRRIVVDSSEMIDVEQDFDTEGEGRNSGDENEGGNRSLTTEADENAAKQNVDRPLDDTLFTALSITGYITLGYLVGLLWAAPAFVAVYTYWFRLKWYLIVGLSAASFAISYAFMELMYLSLDEGILFGVI